MDIHLASDRLLSDIELWCHHTRPGTWVRDGRGKRYSLRELVLICQCTLLGGIGVTDDIVQHHVQGRHQEQGDDRGEQHSEGE